MAAASSSPAKKDDGEAQLGMLPAWPMLGAVAVGIAGLLAAHLELIDGLEQAFEKLGALLLRSLESDVITFALPVAFSRFAIPAARWEPLPATLALSGALGALALWNRRALDGSGAEDFSLLLAAQAASYVFFAPAVPGAFVGRLLAALASAAAVAVAIQRSLLQEAIAVGFGLLAACGASKAATFVSTTAHGGSTAFKAGLIFLGFGAGVFIVWPLTRDALTWAITSLFPLAELGEAYKAIEVFIDPGWLRRSTMELFLVTANVQIAIGYLGIAVLRRIQERKNALLEVGGPKLDARGYVRHVVWYMLMSAVPYMLQRTIMENVNSFAYGQWQYDIEQGLRIDTFFPATAQNSSSQVLLAAVRESNFTVEGYTGAITSLASTSFDIVERKLFSLPKLALIPGMLLSQPVVVATALPAAIGLDFVRANVMGKLTKRLEKLRRTQQDLANKRRKIEQHDTKNEELIRRGGMGAQTERQWRDVSLKLRVLQVQYDTLSLFKAFVNGLYIQDFVAPGIECVLGFLLEFRHISVADIWVYTRVVEDAIDMLLTRTRKEAALASMRTHMDRLQELSSLLNETSSRGRASCTVDATRDFVDVSALEYRRGSSEVAIPSLQLQLGKIYAVTGANGCGKSTFFSLLASCGRKAPVLPAGLEIGANSGTLVLPSDDVVEITQHLYCPLYSTPRSWLLLEAEADCARSNATADGSGEGVCELEAAEQRIERLTTDLRFFGAGEASAGSRKAKSDATEAGGLSTAVLNVVKDDWHSQLSGGQRCKLELIRQVFLRKACPRIVLIDEAFAPLDPESRQVVQTRLRDFCRNSLLLVIHHSDAQERCVPAGFFDDNLHFENGTAGLIGTCSS
eukprot:TRINITY_DN9162_c3_g4_i1.p1 TRINITY_DN9162_c3_g4~~TRINITY_DN9162_c3_g4_i1.p1  ORF type:complete len:858 (-),score=205.56 TRINITY_DN9162_c3_g4_i1:103-2676(-)